MQPTLSDVHVNVPLTQISIAYRQDATQFIAARAFPIVPVAKQSDRYYSYTKDYWFRSEAQERLPAAESEGREYTVNNTNTYNARIYAVHVMVDAATRANSDSALSPDRDATNLVTDDLLLKREKIFVNKFFGTGLWGGAADQTGAASSPGSNQFLGWDLAGSTPIEDVMGQILNVAELTGRRPNKLILGPRVANALVNNPEIIDRVKHVEKAFLDYGALAAAFGVDEILVPFVTQNTAPEGAALNMNFMYGNSALLLYAPSAPGLLTPSAGYTFSWQGYLNGQADIAVYKFWMQEKKADRVEGEMAFDMKVIGSDLGVFFTNCVV
ncbi:MAG: hypothetical protein LC754_06140 [Acidobacteria bacterium]|nr:hypothetical protein [Acidobacteriota bacterium]